MTVEALRAKEGMSGYTKGSITGLFEALLPQLPAALTHAQMTLDTARLEAEMNPSTPLHKLIDRLINLGKPISLDV